MRICPAHDCGVSVADDSLRFCPECSSDLDPTADPLTAPSVELNLGPTIVPASQSSPSSSADSAKHSLGTNPAGGAGSNPIPPASPSLASASTGHPTTAPGGGTRGSGWIRGPLDPIAASPSSVDAASSRTEPIPGGLPLPAPPPLPDFMRAASDLGHATPQPRARFEFLPELDERVGFLIDLAPQLRVGASSSLFVRFERAATPQQMELHLHWELEVDGARVIRETRHTWHADDWDQDATLGVVPSRSGEVRLDRLSMALVSTSSPGKFALRTVRDVPITFRVEEARGTGTVQVNVHGNANALSIRADSSTPASELASRQLRQHTLVHEANKDWWQKRKHTLARASGQRALLSWHSQGGPRFLMICSHPDRFHFGRQKQSGQFVTRWLPCKPGADERNDALSRAISRSHLSVEISPSRVVVRRLTAAGTAIQRLASSPQISAGAAGNTVAFEAWTSELLVLQRAETLALGGHAVDGSDGLQLRFAPLTNTQYCAVLVERVNNTTHLAYLGFVSPTRLEPRGFLEGLPRNLQVECTDGCIELKGPVGLDLGELRIDLRECDDDAFTE